METAKMPRKHEDISSVQESADVFSSMWEMRWSYCLSRNRNLTSSSAMWIKKIIRGLSVSRYPDCATHVFLWRTTCSGAARRQNRNPRTLRLEPSRNLITCFTEQKIYSQRFFP